MTPPKRTFICAGGGGVGKTTTSAALALSLCQRGATTLIVTVDPARRLAAAMGVDIDASVHGVDLGDGHKGRLYALMPEPRASTRAFIELLFEGEPEAKARILRNPVYRLLADAAAGMHEVVSAMLVADAIQRRAYDYLIIDTAPSRQGLDFLGYPGRLATLYESRAVSWLGALAGGVEGRSSPPSRGGGLFSAGRRRIEELFSRLINPQTLRDLAGLFADLAIVKERFASLARVAERLLLGDQTRYLMVAAPTGSAAADVQFLARRLRRMGQQPSALLLNRADDSVPAWVETLSAATDLPAEIQPALETVVGELRARKRAGDWLEEALSRKLSSVSKVRLPTLQMRDPSQIVRALAVLLTPHLRRLEY